MGVLITGVGGTGVVTIGAVLGMAAHLDGLGVGIIDMAGLAQKGGAVTTHMKIAPRPEDIHSIRIARGGGRHGARLRHRRGRLEEGAGGDPAGREPRSSSICTRPIPAISRATPISRCRRGGCSARSRSAPGPGARISSRRSGSPSALMGDAIAANMFMVGFAWQQGGLPLSRASILEAIRLNGVEVEMNAAAFEWGRRAAHDLGRGRRARRASRRSRKRRRRSRRSSRGGSPS